MKCLILIVAGLVALWLISWIVEGLRPQPSPPESFDWAPNAILSSVTVNNIQIRYLVTGEGPNIVLLHTLRTQLDLFSQIINELAEDFQVYVMDYPGHGFSDIPRADYTPKFFAHSVRGFLERLEINNATIVGESIGGTLGLLLAAEHNPRVQQVIAINTYDYDRGRGIMRGSLFARLVFSLSTFPLVGGIIWRLRWFGIFAKIMQGSVHKNDSLPQVLLRHMHDVGNRRRHYQAFQSLVAHFPEWEEVRSQYSQIEIPVLLLYSEFDWSNFVERQQNLSSISTARLETIPDAGHLLSLDAPKPLLRKIRKFLEKV